MVNASTRAYYSARMTLRGFASGSRVTGTGLSLDIAPALTPRGPVALPSFFHGVSTRPEVLARALLVLADITATRYTTRTPSALKDPVLTAQGDRLRIETFSACGSVHARLDLLAFGVDGGEIGFGTTNVDIGDALRTGLLAVRGDGLLHLDVAAEELRVVTGDGAFIERRVEMPPSWVPALGTLTMAQESLRPVLLVGAVAARRELTSAMRRADRVRWVQRAGGELGETRRPTAGGVVVHFPGRLAALTRLLLHIRSMTVHAMPGGAPGPVAVELELPGARFTLTLAEQRWSGGGRDPRILAALTDPRAVRDADLLAVVLAFEPVVDPVRLTGSTGLEEARVRDGLRVLAGAGTDRLGQPRRRALPPGAPRRHRRGRPRDRTRGRRASARRRWRRHGGRGGAKGRRGRCPGSVHGPRHRLLMRLVPTLRRVPRPVRPRAGGRHRRARPMTTRSAALSTAIAVLEELGWHGRPLAELVARDLGAAAQRRILVDGLERGSWWEWVEPGEGATTTRAVFEGIDEDAVALAAIRAGVGVPRTAELIGYLRELPMSTRIALLHAHGPGFAEDVLTELVRTTRREFEHEPSWCAEVCCVLVDELDVPVPAAREYLKDWIALVCAAFGDDRWLWDTARAEVPVRREVLTRRAVEHAELCARERVPATGPLIPALRLLLDADLLRRDDLVRICFIGIDRARRPGDRLGWSRLLIQDLAVTTDELAEHADVLIPPGRVRARPRGAGRRPSVGDGGPADPRGVGAPGISSPGAGAPGRGPRPVASDARGVDGPPSGGASDLRLRDPRARPGAAGRWSVDGQSDVGAVPRRPRPG